MPIRRIQRGRNHSYTIDGKKAIGVTTAISDGMPKPALINWAARTVAEGVWDMDADTLQNLRELGRDAFVSALKAAPNKKRDDAAVRGTKIHHLAEKLVRGEDVAVEDPALIAHVENAARFMDEWKVQPVLNESVIGSYVHGYAGTLDLVADIPHNRRVLFDYKTGASGIWPDHALQLAAYRWADIYVNDAGEETNLRDLNITHTKAVWVRADGYDVIPLSSDGYVFQAFRAVLAVAKARAGMASWLGESELLNPTADYPHDYFAQGAPL